MISYTNYINGVYCWKPSKVNGNWIMTRPEGSVICGRRMTKWERVRYFWLRDDKSVKSN